MTDAEFREFLKRGRDVGCILVEQDYIDEVAGAPVKKTIYFTDREFFDTVTNHPYRDVLRSAPQYSRALSGEQLGTYVASVGSLELLNDDGDLDFMEFVAVDGQETRLYYGPLDGPVSDFKLIFTAIADVVTAPAFQRISIALKDTGLLLDKSVGGQNVIGGSGPNADKARAANFGYIHNEQATLIDQSTLLYSHSDNGFNTAAVQVRARAVSVAYTDTGTGSFNLSASPPGGAMITCDVLAEPNGVGNTMISDAMAHFVGARAGLTAAGKYAGPHATFTVHDVNDYKVGISLSEAQNLIALLARLTESGNCFWAVTRLGQFTYGRLRLNDIAAFGLTPTTINADDITPGSSFKLDHAAPQYYRYQATMSRNWTRQTDFAGSVTPDEQALYSRQGLYRQQDDSIGTSYLNAPELYHKTLAVSPVVDTLISMAFSSPTDTDMLDQWMVTRRIMLLPWIELITVVVGLEFYTLELGDVVSLTLQEENGTYRFGSSSSGVLYQVIAANIRLSDAKVELRLARRTVIQPIPTVWTRENPAVDSTVPEYQPRPPVITPIDVGPGPILINPDGSRGVDLTGRWRIVFARAKKQNCVHPDVLLWVNFADGTAKDRSSYNLTPNATLATGTIDTTGLHWDYTDSVVTNKTVQISYNIFGLRSLIGAPQTAPITIEGFIKWIHTENNTDPIMWFNIRPIPTGGAADVRRFESYANAGKVKYNDSGLGDEAGPTAANVLAPAGTLYHWAWVIPSGSSGTQYFYVNGVAVLSYAGGVNLPTFATDADFLIGGQMASNGSSPFRCAGLIGETRVVKRNLYPGGVTFTPPTPGNLLPIPCEPAPPTIVQVQTKIFTSWAESTGTTPDFDYGAVQPGDLLILYVVTAQGTSVSPDGHVAENGTASGLPSDLLTVASNGANFDSSLNGFTCTPFSVGEFAAHTFSGGYMNVAVFMHLRGTSGKIYGAASNHNTTLTATHSAPALSTAGGSLAISIVAQLTVSTAFTASIAGAGWTQQAAIVGGHFTDGSSPTKDRYGGLAIATNTGYAGLAAAVGTFSASGHNHHGASFYVRSNAVALVYTTAVACTTDTGSITFTFPAAQNGDVLIVDIVKISANSVSAPSDWTVLHSRSPPAGTYLSYYKVATGGETSVTFSLSSGNGMKAGVFVNYRGANLPFTSSGDGQNNSGGTTSTRTTPFSTGPGGVGFGVGLVSFQNHGAASAFTGSVSGAGWSVLQQAYSNTPTGPQSGIVLAVNTSMGQPVASATVTYTVAGGSWTDGYHYLVS